MICDCPVGGGNRYVLGEGIINICVQGGSFIIVVISKGVHLLTGIAHLGAEELCIASPSWEYTMF